MWMSALDDLMGGLKVSVDGLYSQAPNEGNPHQYMIKNFSRYFDEYTNRKERGLLRDAGWEDVFSPDKQAMVDASINSMIDLVLDDYVETHTTKALSHDPHYDYYRDERTTIPGVVHAHASLLVVSFRLRITRKSYGPRDILNLELIALEAAFGDRQDLLYNVFPHEDKYMVGGFFAQQKCLEKMFALAEPLKLSVGIKEIVQNNTWAQYGKYVDFFGGSRDNAGNLNARRERLRKAAQNWVTGVRASELQPEPASQGMQYQFYIRPPIFCDFIGPAHDGRGLEWLFSNKYLNRNVQLWRDDAHDIPFTIEEHFSAIDKCEADLRGLERKEFRLHEGWGARINEFKNKLNELDRQNRIGPKPNAYQKKLINNALRADAIFKGWLETMGSNIPNRKNLNTTVELIDQLTVYLERCVVHSMHGTRIRGALDERAAVNDLQRMILDMRNVPIQIHNIQQDIMLQKANLQDRMYALVGEQVGNPEIKNFVLKLKKNLGQPNLVKAVESVAYTTLTNLRREHPESTIQASEMTILQSLMEVFEVCELNPNTFIESTVPHQLYWMFLIFPMTKFKEIMNLSSKMKTSSHIKAVFNSFFMFEFPDTLKSASSDMQAIKPLYDMLFRGDIIAISKSENSFQPVE